MNYWPLLGIAIVVIGFVVRFNPVAVVVAAGLVSGLLAGKPIGELLALLGESFINNRALLLFALTLRAYPYPQFRTRALGVPVDTIGVLGAQWGWSLDRNTVPAHVPVEFVVRSKDVNHDFAVYDAGGTLLVQVQAMPGYANRLIYRFDRPGTYTVRCLEYCGMFHHIMLTTFTVR